MSRARTTSVSRPVKLAMTLLLCVSAVLALGTAAARADPFSWSGPFTLDRTGARPFDAVSCPSSTQCTTVDNTGQMATFDPSSGTVAVGPSVLMPNARLSAISCPSTTQCTAVADPPSGGSEVTFDPTTGAANAAGVRPVFTGQQGGLVGVSCPSTSQCTAVDNQGDEITFDPTTGALNAAGAKPVDAGLGSVTCASSTQCTAVDFEGTETTFDPTTGTINPAGNKTIDGGNGFQSVSCSSGTLCTAVDARGQEVTFDPTSGTANAAGVKDVDGSNWIAWVSCLSATQCTAVDHSGNELTFDPTSGTVNAAGVKDVDGTRTLNGVACGSAGACTAVDATGAEVTYAPADGTVNAAGVTPVDTGRRLNRISCPSDTQCTAVDTNGAEVTFDPTSGTVNAAGLTSVAGTNSLTGVSCPSVTQCTASVATATFGARGEEVTFDPTTGTANAAGLETVDGASALTSVSCPTAGECTGVDSAGGEVTFDPGTGAANAAGVKPIDGSVFLHDVSCPSASQCTALDNNSHEITFDPASGTVNAAGAVSLGGPAVSSVSCPATTQCTAVGFSDEVTFDPTSGTLNAAGLSAVDNVGNLGAVSCPSTGQCTAVDDSGHEITFDPASPGTATPTPIAGANGLTSVACTSTAECAAVDVVGNGFAGTTGTPPVRHVLTVSVAGSGSVTSTDGNISCPGACTHSYVEGTQVTLNAAPASGSTFGGWSGGGCSGAGACAVTMRSDQGITATFDASGSGGGSGGGSSGNSGRSGGPSGTTPDASAPTISIRSPGDGATILQGARVLAAYGCSDPDGAADVATCAGPVAPGQPVDTGTAGAHEFTVTAADRAGNRASRTVAYTVVADENAPFPGCRSPRVLRSYTLSPHGSKVRIAFAGPTRARISVDVFAHTYGRRIVLDPVRVAHFSPRRTFSWNGRPNVRGRTVADGIYSVRITAHRDGKTDTRELTLIRVRGRFHHRVGFFRPASCDNLRVFTLGQPGFGGSASRPLRITYALRRATTVLVQVYHGTRLVAAFHDGLRAAGRLWRHAIPARRHPDGDYKVFITLGTAPGILRSSLVTRRL